MTTALSSRPTLAEDGLDTILVVLRQTAGASRPDDAVTPVGAIEVPLPDGRTAAMSPAWYDLVGDLQARLVYVGPTSMRTLHTEELTALGLTPEKALAAALGNLERLHGAPAASPWHELQSVGGKASDYDSSYFLDRAFWRRQLAGHPQGLVVAVPRTDLLLFAPLADTPAVASLRKGISGLHAGAGDYRLSSGLYLFKDDRWSLLPADAPAR
ncbi:MAG: hypothetical protein ABJD97_22065 [Betaproteobacteria bacterium]